MDSLSEQHKFLVLLTHPGAQLQSCLYSNNSGNFASIKSYRIYDKQTNLYLSVCFRKPARAWADAYQSIEYNMYPSSDEASMQAYYITEWQDEKLNDEYVIW